MSRVLWCRLADSLQWFMKEKNILNSSDTKRADREPMFHWWCLVIKYLVILSKFELVKNFEIKLKNLTTKRCINDLANKPWLNEEIILFPEKPRPLINDHPGRGRTGEGKVPHIEKSQICKKTKCMQAVKGWGGLSVRRPPECGGGLQRVQCTVHGN